MITRNSTVRLLDQLSKIAVRLTLSNRTKCSLIFVKLQIKAILFKASMHHYFPNKQVVISSFLSGIEGNT